MRRYGTRATYTQGLGFAVLSFGSLAVLSTVSSVVTARIYGIETLGRYALVLAALNATMLLSTVRERPAFVREIAMSEPRDARVTGLFVAVGGFSAVLTLVVGAVVAVVAGFVYAGPIGHPELLMPAVATLAAYALIDNTNQSLDTVFSAFRAGRRLFSIRLFQAGALFAISLGLGLASPSLWCLVIAYAAAAALSLVYRVLAVRSLMRLRVPRADLRAGLGTLPDVIRFGLKIAPGGLADGVSNESGTWVLGVTSSLPVVGAYNRAWMITRQLMALNVRITEMLFPTLVERRAREERAGFDRALVDTLRYTVAATLLIAGAGGGAAVGIMRLFGPGFASASTALIVLLLVPGLVILSAIQRHALYALDRPLTGSAAGGLRMVCTLAASIGLGLVLGPTGVAIALCAGLLADVAFCARWIVPELSTPLSRLWPVRQVIGVLVAYAAGFLCARAIYDAVANPGGLLLALVAGTLAFTVVAIAGGGLLGRDRQRLLMLRRLLARRIDVSPGQTTAH